MSPLDYPELRNAVTMAGGAQNVIIGPEAARWLWVRLELDVATGRHPERILDLGAGFTSLWFREWALAHSPPLTDVWTVDSDERLLRATEVRTVEKKLSAGMFMNLDKWIQLGPSRPRFPFVFLNLFSPIERMKILPDLLTCIAPGGSMIIADWHLEVSAKPIREFLLGKGYRIAELVDAPLDCDGRRIAEVFAP